MPGDNPTAPNFDSIPYEMRDLKQWVLWKLESKKGQDKPAKIPYTIHNTRASSTKRSDWCSYDEAVKAYQAGSFRGIGFVFTGDDEFIFLDWDDPVLPDDLLNLQSYTEKSQSLKGYHIFLKGKIPEGANKRRKGSPIELYEKERFCAITGYVIDDNHQQVRSISDPDIRDLCYRYNLLQTPGTTNYGKNSYQTRDRSDDEIINIIRKSSQSGKFERLMSGNTSEYGNDWSSADMALCDILAFYTKDIFQIERIWRSSGLWREKSNTRPDYVTRTIQSALSKVTGQYSGSANTPKEAREIVLTDLKNHDDTKLSISELNLTDIGNALRFEAQYGDKFKFDFSKNLWYYWNDEIWQVDNNGCVKKAAQYTIAKMADEIKVLMQSGDTKAGDMVFRHMKRSSSERARSDMLKTVAPHLNVNPGIWNSKPELLNIQNGTLDIETLHFRGFNKEDYLTFKAGVKYEPGAKCPEWLDHLSLVFGNDTDLISAFQLMAGYSLLSGNPAQVFFIPYGAGKNGKSVTINTLRMIMGDYGIHIAPESLMAQKNPNKARSDLVRIQYKTLVTSAESEKGAKLDIGWIKQISGGEPIVARALYQSEIEFRVEAVIWFATNHLPVINEASEAIWRRIWLIPFNQVIPEDKRIPEYEQKLIESEGSGILNWMIEGLQRYYSEGGLIKPNAIKQATDEYREDEDPLGEFLEQCCVIEPDAIIIDRELYGYYRDWCLNAGMMHPMKKNTFTRNLIDHPGVRSGRNKFNRLYQGVRMKTEADKVKESEDTTKTVLNSFNNQSSL